MKFISEKIISKKCEEISQSKIFLPFFCAVIFLLSIFLRSTIDIGADTGVYLDLGKKVANGGKYYYDFFESNFPLSFYFYAAEFHLSNFLHLNPIFTSEIVINILAILSIFWSSQILKRTTIHDCKAHYNLIIIAYTLGFFLRVNGLTIGEFGTKTSLLLICLFPYISSSFERKTPLNNRELTWRGILMGLMPCLKPHYLIFIIFIEFYKFWQKKSLNFFLKLDKLLMLAIGLSYLVLMLKFTPEFFEFIVPMWPKVYSAYDNSSIFLNNVTRHFAARILIFSFIFLIFTRLKLSQNDKILTLLFCAASLLMALENIGTIDQIVIFYAITTICFLKFSYDLISSKKLSFSDNKFIIATLIFLPIFDLENLPSSIFSISGFINVWWLIALIYPAIMFVTPHLLPGKLETKKHWLKLRKEKIIFLILAYFSLILFTALSSFYLGKWGFISANLISLFLTLFFFEKFYAKFYQKFSPFFTFTVTASASCLMYAYIASIAGFINIRSDFQSPNKLTENIAATSKIYAPKTTDGILVFSTWIPHQFPILNYLGKENHSKSNIFFSEFYDENKDSQSKLDLDRILTLEYLFNDLKKQLLDPNMKVLFINNDVNIFNKTDRCLIGSLEYYFLDLELKKIFLKNFRYENRIFVTEKIKRPFKGRVSKQNEKDIFDQVKPASERIIYDFEVYVRKES